MGPKESALDAQEIASHRSTSSCWIVVDGKAYDVTSYLDEHPGGAAVLLMQGGTVRKYLSRLLYGAFRAQFNSLSLSLPLFPLTWAPYSPCHVYYE